MYMVDGKRYEKYSDACKAAKQIVMVGPDYCTIFEESDYEPHLEPVAIATRKDNGDIVIRR